MKRKFTSYVDEMKRIYDNIESQDPKHDILRISTLKMHRCDNMHTAALPGHFGKDGPKAIWRERNE